jgi:cytochrome P450
MWLGIGVFLFIFAVGRMTLWRVHSQVCDSHLVVLPTPEDPEADNIFRHGAALFNTEAILGFFLFWRRRRTDESIERKLTAGPVPVEPTPKALNALRRWATSVAGTFRMTLFGRRVVLTSAPRFARRVLHTHFKLYSKDPTNDPNSQLPRTAHWLMPDRGRSLFSRPDAKDRTPHGATRTAYAQALLRTVYDAHRLRAVAREVVATGTSPSGSLTREEIRVVCLRATLSLLLGKSCMEQLFAGPALQELKEAMAAVQAELEREVEEPWRWYVVRLSPAWRARRNTIARLATAAATHCLDVAQATRTAPSSPKELETVPPLVAFLQSESPDLASLPDAVVGKAKQALVNSAAAELITALLMASGPMATAVAWSLHYLALPQHHTLVKMVRSESLGPSAPTPAGKGPETEAERLPGAVEVLREVLRLHPPIPVLTRTAISDDMVAVSDIDVPNDKFNHVAAAQMDGTPGRGSFAQRSGSVIIPSSCVVAINLDVMLKRPDVFGADAAEFKPRRFVALAAIAATPGEAAGGRQNADPSTWFLTGGFGIGARGCPATQWATPVCAELLRAFIAQSEPYAPNRQGPHAHLAPGGSACEET